MNNGKSINVKSFCEYILLNIIVLIVLIFSLRLWHADLLTYPLSYSGGGDDVQVIFVLQTLLEEGPVGNSSRVGVPYVTESLDLVAGNYLTMFFRWIIVKICNSPVIALNMIFFLGFFLTTNITYFILKKLGISKGSSFVGAVLYAFIPFHFYRSIQHFDFALYWTVPLIMYICILYMKRDYIFHRNENTLLNKENIMHFIFLILIASRGVYYTYFACFFLCVVILCKILRKEKVREAFASLGIIIGAFLINCIPKFISFIQYGSNPIIRRNAAEVEINGLKIISLLLPVDEHRIDFLRKLREMYNDFPLTNENCLNSMGLFMSIGFIYLIVELLKSKHTDSNIHACSILNICAIILSTIGGVASFIGLFFAYIRCYNRISIYIAFLSLVGAVTLVDIVKNKFKKTYLQVAMLIIILFIGLFDQTSDYFILNYEETKTKWDNAAQFVAQIEESESEGAMIYQMPYVTYPEGVTNNDVTIYSHISGFLHSDTLKWSYGAYKGRKGDAWYRNVSKMSVDEQISEILGRGFAGIYINKQMYKDINKISESDFDWLINKLVNITKTKPLISNDWNLYYFSLKDYDKNYKNYQKIIYGFYDGFFEEEFLGDKYWTWCSSSGDIVFYNENDTNKKTTITMNINILLEGNYILEISSKDSKKTFHLAGGKNSEISFDVILEPGENIVKLKSNIPTTKVDSDVRDLAFAVENLNYTIKE